VLFCVEDLLGRDGDVLYKLDCEMFDEKVNLQFLRVYRNAVEFAKGKT